MADDSPIAAAVIPFPPPQQGEPSTTSNRNVRYVLPNMVEPSTNVLNAQTIGPNGAAMRPEVDAAPLCEVEVDGKGRCPLSIEVQTTPHL